MKQGITIITAILVTTFSCRQGSGTISESALESDEVNHDSLVVNPTNPVPINAPLFFEDRSADPSALPKIIDVLSQKELVSEIKLSDFSDKVTYIKLEKPEDTTLLWSPGLAKDGINLEFGFDSDYIVVSSILGLSLFNIYGEFLGTFGKNSLVANSNNGRFVFRSDEFVGIPPEGPFYFGNGLLLYTLANGPKKVLSIMEYLPSVGNSDIKRLNRADTSGVQMFLGDTLLAFKTDYGFIENFDMVASTGTTSWAGIYSPFTGGQKGTFMGIFDYNGDTLTLFSDYDKIVEWKFGDYRNAVSNTSYDYNGMLTVKSAYNDTVFRVIPPNRLLPVYIIKYGDQVLTKEEGLRSDVDLSDRYVNYSLIETDDNLFIRYTRNYNCPTNRNEKTVWFYNVLYDKSYGTIIHDIKSENFPQGILNDIDGGVPFWPQKVVKGKMAQIISGKMVKEKIASTEFREKWSQSEQGKRLITLASGLTDEDIIIMVVE